MARTSQLKASNSGQSTNSSEALRKARQNMAKNLHKHRNKKHPCNDFPRYKGQFVKKSARPGVKPPNYKTRTYGSEERYEQPSTRKMEADQAKRKREQQRMASARYRRFQANRKPQGKANKK